ncbi:hypothetical protein GE21DRAFT_7288 [Neurospora crassa]|uniref:Zn(2)-C6 fungal-type domain-containing protein n=1 Tax=Neurospora crassa (strain ATCC 24698 / 74-OR23-1A / CBS 708.71 / DSM 1257 / FGSC 987) TaxID=367110 RepID=Q1K7X8_NEUCR|nr:hypothetical protein NCU03728 [Neurospora crassa OR74A]EAA32268.3 hypothetical protein NCU03728 [Neurospora crassa OR74A]KHE88207.1 hypothetical protein GE21DRAFT_7288 [Neurospora crassa]|eukprot:XP_961504.3 hypothetical protein NCU03728 [Neurospora crassa OR74A]
MSSSPEELGHSPQFSTLSSDMIAISAMNDTAVDALQRPKRARTSKPKVKTGCSNCKLRRIKCDEKRPACSNCVRSRKDCTGYPPPPRSARPSEVIKIAPKPGPAPPTPLPGRDAPIQLAPRRVVKYQRRNTPPQTPRESAAAAVTLHRSPAANVPFTDREGLYFQLFREHTANELSGFFDSGFWSRTVLQECHFEPTIRHAVVALGALYKTLEKTCESPPGSPASDRDPTDLAMTHFRMALEQYHEAIRSLINTADPMSNRTRLMASVLLACFDSFVGDHKQAIFQIQTGLQLLEKLRAERRRAFITQPGEPVEDELIQMFTRLAIQAKSYDMAFHFPQPYVVRLTPIEQDPSSPASDVSSPGSQFPDPIPDRFASVIEARVAWDKLCERIFKFTETMFKHVPNGPMGLLPPNLKRYGLGFKQDLDAWSEAFEPILQSRTAPSVTTQEKAAIAVLKMFQIMALILFLMTFNASEMQFDNFNSYFKTIVDLALEVVGDEERRAAAKRCPDPDFCRHGHGHNTSYERARDMFGGHNEYAARHIKPSFSADLGIVPPLFVVATKCRDPVIRRQAIQLLRSSARREAMWDSELTARIGMWITEIEESDDFSMIVTPGSSPVASFSQMSMSMPMSMAMDESAVVDTMDGAASGSKSGVVRSDSNGSANGIAPTRWGRRTGSSTSSTSTATTASGSRTHYIWPTQQQQQQQQFAPAPAPAPKVIIPEERRVMVRAVEFDLHKRTATVQLGTRGLQNGQMDLKTRKTSITW